MLNIVLKNVEHVEQTRHVIRERFEPLLREFPELHEHTMTVIVDGVSEAERLSGRPMSIRAIVLGRQFRAIARVQTVSDVYAASANVATRLWRRLRRAAQQLRARSAMRERQAVQHAA
jgi:ribosome-associated translation inhibitor RaiA